MVFSNTFRLAPGLALLTALLGASLNVATAPVAQAQVKAPSAPIEVDLKAFKVTRDDKGKEQFVDASRAKPGDIIEYRAVYANVSTKGVKDLKANLPIPENTSIIFDTVVPKTAQVSVDGKKFGAYPMMRTVKNADGTTQTRPYAVSSYRVLRWPVGSLAAGDSVSVKARVRLNSADSATN